MDELQIGLRHQVLRSETQSLLPGRVQILKVPVKASNTKHVYRQVDKSVSGFQPGIEGCHKSAHSQADQYKHQPQKPHAPFHCPNSAMQSGQWLFNENSPTVLTHWFVSN